MLLLLDLLLLPDLQCRWLECDPDSEYDLLFADLVDFDLDAFDLADFDSFDALDLADFDSFDALDLDFDSFDALDLADLDSLDLDLELLPLLSLEAKSSTSSVLSASSSPKRSYTSSCFFSS